MSDLGNALKDINVLVAEDALFIAFALEAVVKAAGASDVLIATRLEAAVDLARSAQFDVAVLDLRFPDGDSYDLALGLLHQNKPVVIYSAHATDRQKERLDGAVFCEKPALPDEIVRALHSAIETQKQASNLAIIENEAKTLTHTA